MALLAEYEGSAILSLFDSREREILYLACFVGCEPMRVLLLVGASDQYLRITSPSRDTAFNVFALTQYVYVEVGVRKRGDT